ncbi:MAG: polynucleotide adenylyltransferase PcnB, partial [Leptothrix sp. (in: b-proteobacteria)]
EQFIQLALADTDRRVSEGKPVAPSFMLSCMLWHEVQARWTKLRADQPLVPALQQAIDEVFNARIGDISGRGKLAADMREIWMMQPRFERRTPSGALSLVGQPRFRAGFDFLRLRAHGGEIDTELANWWEDFSTADGEQRHELLEQVRRAPAKQRSHAPRAASAPSAPTLAAGAETSDATGEAKKRRRRRRKPSEAGAAGGISGGGGD